MRHEPHDATIAKRIEVPSPFSCQTSLQYAPWLGHREKQRSGKAEKKMLHLVQGEETVSQRGQGHVRGDEEAGNAGEELNLSPDSNPSENARGSREAAHVEPCGQSDGNKRHR